MKKSPLVLCLTNTVAANFTANCLLAVGAKPAMIEEPCEAAELAAHADALLMNVGTLTTAQAAAMRGAVEAAQQASVPWVLDPVACHCLSFRRRFVLEMIGRNPSLVRGNCTEIAYLRQFHAHELGPVPILETAEVDRIYVDGRVQVEVSGGVPILGQVTATGCAQGAICAAFLSWGQTPVKACVSASKLMKKAGELAFAQVQTPGSFQIALLDALSELADEYL